MSALPEPPAVAVVVPTHNRGERLERLVRALEAQVDAPPFEVVVVDDCSTDDTAAVLEGLPAASSLRLVVLRTERNAGPATARNLGWRAATAPLIAFTDDDCVPRPGWLAALVRAADDHAVVQGRTVPDPERAVGRGPFARTMIVEEPTPFYETCNIVYRRQLLEQLGGFDEAFPAPFGEDVDLAWRAIERGVAIGWEPGAEVVHDVDHDTYVGDWLAWLRHTARRESAVLMVRKHPGLRAHMHWRVFYQASHPPALLLAAGAAGVLAHPRSVRRWALATGAAVPWLVYRTVLQPRPARTRNLPAVLPMTLVADLAEVAVMVRGSVRERTLLL